MIKKLISLAALVVLCGSASAFSLSDVASAVSSSSSSSSSSNTSSTIENVVSTVASAITGGTTVSASTLTGTWSYSSPAVKLQSDNALTEVAGTLATSQIETKLSSVYSAAGITASSFSFTFNSDMSFTCSTKRRTLSGTYSVESNDTIKLTFSALGTINLGSMTVSTSVSSSTLSLLFNADKLLDIVSAISTVSESLSTINSLLSNYNRVMVGFNLTK